MGHFDPTKLKPIRQRILVLKCLEKDTGPIVLPEFMAERSLFAEIINVADDCRIFSKENIGELVKLKANGADQTAWYPGQMKRLPGFDENGKPWEFFLIRESLIDRNGMVGATWKE